MNPEIKKLIVAAANDEGEAQLHVEYDDDRSVAICMGRSHGYMFRALELIEDESTELKRLQRGIGELAIKAINLMGAPHPVGSNFMSPADIIKWAAGLVEIKVGTIGGARVPMPGVAADGGDRR